MKTNVFTNEDVKQANLKSIKLRQESKESLDRFKRYFRQCLLIVSTVAPLTYLIIWLIDKSFQLNEILISGSYIFLAVIVIVLIIALIGLNANIHRLNKQNRGTSVTPLDDSL